jgi:hypothetical protein
MMSYVTAQQKQKDWTHKVLISKKGFTMRALFFCTVIVGGVEMSLPRKCDQIGTDLLYWYVSGVADTSPTLYSNDCGQENDLCIDCDWFFPLILSGNCHRRKL